MSLSLLRLLADIALATDSWPLEGAAESADHCHVLTTVWCVGGSGDSGTDFDRFPLGHTNLAGNTTAATELQAHRAVLAKFFRDGDAGSAFGDGC